ncbi:DUF4932 domain-containing protein [Rufibacter immobilis]|uniref:DUF4932 domain-containing protein n=1 Tax=Rufibacter immobilis TaxID=1348778 RepID=UPI0035ECE4AB
MKILLFSPPFILLIFLAGCKTPVPTISKSYEEAIGHNIQVEVPEVYEAVQIALSLTDTYQSDLNLINSSTPYYHEMISQFSKHKSHPLVLKLEKKLKKAGAYGEVNTLIRFQALNYRLKDEKLEKKNRYNIPFIYNVAPYPLFLLHKNKRLINSFVQETAFDMFYKQHKGYYDSLILRSRELSDYEGMQQWLEREFPQVQNESFLIVFSPLTAGLHNMREYKSKSGNKKQTIMFVSAPDYETGVWEERSELEKSAYASRVVFTEINHSYVNPTTTQHIDQIESAMQDLKGWKTENVTGGYNSFSLTFNEYMTWAVFTLYAYDTYPADVFERVIERQVEFMMSRRGFTRFREFNDKLLSLYKQRKGEKRVAELYPEIIGWVKLNRISTQNTVQ